MKHFFSAILCIFTFSIIGISQCRENPDSLYNERKMLEQIESILKTSIPAYAQYPEGGFFVYDLTEPANYYKSPTYYTRAEGCVNFTNNHIYYFSVVSFAISYSHIAILEDGKMKIFKSINCKNSKDNLADVINYAEGKLKNNKNKNEILTRLKNYRRYGFYRAIDEERVFCNEDEKIPENSDKLFNRWDVLHQFARVISSSVSEKVQRQFSPFFVEESRANGFFVYDLTEPSNKQTSLLERVEFKNNHVYHFAFIDAPFSFSNIAVLEDGKLKIFKAINCKGKADSLEDVVGYLNEKLKKDKNKDEIIKRVKNYREYGVYASFNGLSESQCEEVVLAEK